MTTALIINIFTAFKIKKVRYIYEYCERSALLFSI